MAQTRYLLGIDIGGTGAKAGLFSLDGTSQGGGYGEYRMISNVPGQAEHDAEDWWQATILAIRKAILWCKPRANPGCRRGMYKWPNGDRFIRPTLEFRDHVAEAVRTNPICKVLLMEQHGIVALGANVVYSYNLADLTEELAMIAHLAAVNQLLA